MAKEGFEKGGLSADLLKRYSEWKVEDRARRGELFKKYEELHPVYPTSSEDGAFVGVFEHGGARIQRYPFYRTESGVYFYEWTNIDRTEKAVKELNVEEVLEKKSARFYTRASYMGDEPLAEAGAFPYQAETPLSGLAK